MKKKLIELAYEGMCDKCKSMVCPFYATCVDDGGVEPKCICQGSCTDVRYFL